MLIGRYLKVQIIYLHKTIMMKIKYRLTLKYLLKAAIRSEKLDRAHLKTVLKVAARKVEKKVALYLQTWKEDQT